MKYQSNPLSSVEEGAIASAAALLVASADIAEARSLALPVTLIEVSGSEDKITFRNDTAADLGLSQVRLAAIGCLPLSSSGRKELDRMGAFWEEQTGSPAPQFLTVQGEKLQVHRIAILEWLVLQMSTERRSAATPVYTAYARAGAYAPST